MMQIGCTVLILPNAEYSGKFTGMTGKVGKYYGSAKNGPKVGVEFPGMKNDCESGLFWFSVEKVEVLQTPPFVEYLMNDSAFTATLAEGTSRMHRKRERLPFPDVKKVIFSGPKTIVLWADGTKTIVSCGEGDTYDYYSGFCAAVVKKLFGSTTHAKKVLGKVVQVQ